MKIYVDMDGVLCDYMSQHAQDAMDNIHQPFPQSRWGFFLELKPIKNALESIKKLQGLYDVWILTKPSGKNLNSYAEKAYWIKKHLGEDWLEKLILIPDKSLVKGDFLIDDRTTDGQDKFEGFHIHFGTSEFPDWDSVIDYLGLKTDEDERERCQGCRYGHARELHECPYNSEMGGLKKECNCCSECTRSCAMDVLWF